MSEIWYQSCGLFVYVTFVFRGGSFHTNISYFNNDVDYCVINLLYDVAYIANGSSVSCSGLIFLSQLNYIISLLCFSWIRHFEYLLIHCLHILC